MKIHTMGKTLLVILFLTIVLLTHLDRFCYTQSNWAFKIIRVSTTIDKNIPEIASMDTWLGTNVTNNDVPTINPK